MISEQLQKKIDQAIRLIKSAGADGSTVEVAYSCGKDSDVILQLTKEAGIKYRAIYRMTTLDPSGTIQHAKDMGVEIRKPEKSFFKLIEENGLPNRFARFCCRFLKEFKILDKCIMDVRRAESTKRSLRYKEPTECKLYGNKKEHVEAFYPILEWSDDDVKTFIEDRGIKCAPVYYKDGKFDVTERLGCMACPLKYYRKRIDDFKERPNLLRAYVRFAQRWLDSHSHTRTWQKYNGNVYKWIAREILFERQAEFDELRDGMFGEPDYKELLEQYFNIKF